MEANETPRRDGRANKFTWQVKNHRHTFASPRAVARYERNRDFDFIVEDRELFRAAEARSRPRFKPFMTLMLRIITIKIHQVFNVPVER